VEGVFGGMEIRYGNKTRCRLDHTRAVSTLMMALAHDIRAHLRVLVVVKVKTKEGSQKIASVLQEIIRQPREARKI